MQGTTFLSFSSVSFGIFFEHVFSYHLLYFCTALSLIIMLSSHYHHHKSKTFSQLTQCPFTGTLLLFSLYTTPLSKVIQNHPGISFQFYADDTQLYVHLTHKNAASALDKLSRCLEDIKRWLSTNKLKLNPDKTESIVFGSKSQREKLYHSFPVNILGNLISPVDAVRNLGVWFEISHSLAML